MKIAIPLDGERLSMHFGHCERFAVVEVDREQRVIRGREDVEAPPHSPGLLPPWLAGHDVELVLAGGMGARAQNLFARHGVKVITGVPDAAVEELVRLWLKGDLVTGENVCDH